MLKAKSESATGAASDRKLSAGTPSEDGSQDRGQTDKPAAVMSPAKVKSKSAASNRKRKANDKRSPKNEFTDRGRSEMPAAPTSSSSLQFGGKAATPSSSHKSDGGGGATPPSSRKSGGGGAATPSSSRSLGGEGSATPSSSRKLGGKISASGKLGEEGTATPCSSSKVGGEGSTTPCSSRKLGGKSSASRKLGGEGSAKPCSSHKLEGKGAFDMPLSFCKPEREGASATPSSPRKLEEEGSAALFSSCESAEDDAFATPYSSRKSGGKGAATPSISRWRVRFRTKGQGRSGRSSLRGRRGSSRRVSTAAARGSSSSSTPITPSTPRTSARPRTSPTLKTSTPKTSTPKTSTPKTSTPKTSHSSKAHNSPISALATSKPSTSQNTSTGPATSTYAAVSTAATSSAASVPTAATSSAASVPTAVTSSAASVPTVATSSAAASTSDEMPSGVDHQRFDREIQRKATKAKISVRNVKHIIKSIISNEQVLAMMQYEESRETDPAGTALPPSLEPKMTRSRTRQLLADSQITELPLTPVKRGPASSTEQLILHEFPEDDDDEEYTPRKMVDLSELSSAASSPTPSTPRSASVCSSMPMTPATPCSTSEEPPSRRTRSRLPLTDQPLEELEQLLVAPDVTPDMYFPVDDDDDWAGFLRGFNMPFTNDVQEDEEDEEYVFQLNEEEEVEREELRGDPAVRISQKEVNKLMLELFKDVTELQWAEPAEPEPCLQQWYHQGPLPADRQAMTADQARQLDHQMAAHVQLLAQTHLLSAEQPWLRNERASSAALLVELNSLSAALRPAAPSRSFFCPPNLAPALEMVAELDRCSAEELSDRPSELCTIGKAEYCRLSDRVVDTLLNSTAFVFPELLPTHAPVRHRPGSAGHFNHYGSPPLDQLIAMGLEQFTPYAREMCGRKYMPTSRVCQLIAEHMLPLSARQLLQRVGFVRRHNPVDNPIFVYMDKHRAPAVPSVRTLPPYPLPPLRSRVDELQEPWSSLARLGNAFFVPRGARKGRLVLNSDEMNAKYPPPAREGQPKKPKPKRRRERNGGQRRGSKADGTPCGGGGDSRGEPAAASAADRSDILAMCMPEIATPAPSPTATPAAVGAPEEEPPEEEPPASEWVPCGNDQQTPVPGAEPQPSLAPSPAEHMTEADQMDTAPAVDHAVASAANIEEDELVTVVDAEEPQLDTVATDGHLIRSASEESRPRAAAATIITTGGGSVQRLLPAEGSVIELKEEGGRLVVYVRGPGRPTLRIPVRSAAAATRLLLPPTLALQDTSAGRPPPTAARRTGVVAPTVRQQEPPPPRPPPQSPAVAPPSGSLASDPPAAAVSPRDATPPPADESRLFKQPFTPLKARRTPHKLAPPPPPPPPGGVVTTVYSVTTSVTDAATGGGGDRPAATDVGAGGQTVTTSGAAGPSAATSGAADSSAATSGAAGPSAATSGAAGPSAATSGAAGPSAATSGAAGPSAATSGAAGVPAAADNGKNAARAEGGASSAEWPAPATGLSLPELPAMMPPTLMTPRRPTSPPPPESGLVFGFPTPSVTPAAGLDGRCTPPAHGFLETPLVPHSPPAHALLETPQARHSPPHSPRTPPSPGNATQARPAPPVALSSDSHSNMSLSFFRKTVGDVSATAAAAAAAAAAAGAAVAAGGGRPGPELTSDQSLGGVLDALLTRHIEANGKTRDVATPGGNPSSLQPAAAANQASQEQRTAAAGEPSLLAPVPAPSGAPPSVPAVAPAAAASSASVADHCPDAGEQQQAITRAAAPTGAPPPAVPSIPSAARSAEAASAAGGARTQGVRTRSDAAAVATPQRAAPPDPAASTPTPTATPTPTPTPTPPRPAAPADTGEEAAAQTDEDRELAALMAASTTVLPAGRSSRPKRSRQQREAELTRLALAPEPQVLRDKREEALATHFFHRVRECTESVDPAIYQQFERLLNEFLQSPKDEAALYDEVSRLLKGFPDLAAEFLTFVSPAVAVQRGVVTEHVRGRRLHELVRGIEAVNTAHPTQIQKVTRTLTQMTSRGEEVNATDVQTALQPLVRGCPLLSTQLTSLLDSEAPPAELTRRPADFQTAALDAEPADTEFEEVTELAADEPDPYGTERCPCGCHETGDDVRFLQRRRHCERCGLRFMAGRVYLQTGKVLRPARVISCSEPDEATPAAAGAAAGVAVTSTGDSPPPSKRARRRTGPRAERVRRPRPPPAAASPPPPPPAPAPPAPPPPPSAPAAAETEAPWSREDDLEILTSCQRSGDGEKTFRAIQRRLPSRSVTQLQGRFQQLMIMLRQQMQQEPDEFQEDG